MFGDDATGMQMLGARYYLPALGRFLTQDPIGHEGGLNLYAYCENSPLLSVDPDGLQGDPIRGAWVTGDSRGVAQLASPSWMMAIAYQRLRGDDIDTFNGPSRKRFIQVLRGNYDYIGIMGHGSTGRLYFGTGENDSLTYMDINRIADARERAGMGKMAQITVWECLVMGNPKMVNALLRIAKVVRGYEGLTVSGHLDGSFGRPGKLRRYTRPFPANAPSRSDTKAHYKGKPDN